MTDEMKTWERHVSQAKDRPPTSVGTFVHFDTILAAAAELTRLWAVLAEKEAALCRARDYLTTIKSSVENIAGAFVGYVDVDAMINGLYENTPCPHEEAGK